MLKLNDREWKEFKVGELFNYVRGERQISENRLFGSIPYYSASDTNNGLTDMISNPSFIESKDSIICSTFCQAYYVHGGFSASDEITILNNDRINEPNGLFISQSIIQNKRKYNFGHKAFSKKLANDTILLPVNSTGEPDYAFMEQYIKERQDRMLEKYRKYAEKQLDEIEYKPIKKLEECEWKEFKLVEIFPEFSHGKRLTKENRKYGNIPLLTASAENQAVSDFISNNGMTLHSNFISIDMFGQSFYHDYECYGDDNIYFFENENIPNLSKLFISQLINNNNRKYTYGKQFRGNNARNDRILLPVTPTGEPDYEYMEQFSKNIVKMKLTEYLNFVREYYS